MRRILLKILPSAAVPVVDGIVPLRRLPSEQQVFGLLPWAGVAGLGALWMVQPFDWIQKQVSGGSASGSH